MGRPGDGEGDGDGEQDRLTRVFGAYRQDPRRRAGWDLGNAGNVAIRDELARASLAAIGQPGADGLLLDAGCGSGWWLQRLLAEGIAPSRLVGVDLLADRAAAARERAPEARVLCDDIRSLPLEVSSCVVVTMFSVLSGMASGGDVDAALAEARRVLAPGGTLVIWEPRVVTPNPDTRLIRMRDLRRVLGPDLRACSITLAPPLARRAGRGYRALAALAPLRSHRLVTARPGDRPRPGGRSDVHERPAAGRSGIDQRTEVPAGPGPA